MTGEIHILPDEELQRIRREEYERGRKAGLIEAATDYRRGTQPFGRRVPTIKRNPMRGM